MANPFLDLIKNRDNAEVAEEGNAAFGLGVDPTSIPLEPGLTNAELASQVAQAPAPVVSAPAISRAPASVPISSKADVSSSPAVEEAPKVPGIADRLEQLLAERKQAYADAESRQRGADLISGLSGHIGNIVGGAQAMNTKASVTPPKVTVGAPDILGRVDGKYKPELDNLMTQYKALQQANKPLSEKDKLWADLTRQQLELSKQRASDTNYRFGESQDRLWNKQKFDQEEKQELTPAQLKEITNIETTLDSLNEIPVLKTFSTGPISGRVEAVKRTLGKGTPERTALAAQLNMIVSQYGKAISGSAIAEQEFKRIQSQLPNENDDDDNFAAKLGNFQRSMADSRLRVLDSYKRGGRNVDKIKDRKSIEQLRSEAEGGKSSSDPKIDGYAKQHGLSYEAAEKILRGRGYNG